MGSGRSRVAGILLHPTSLPGGFGVGDLGPPADRFLEFLQEAGLRLWQVLPLGPTGYGDSPYQSFSAFAGNPLLISPERLVEQGLLSRRDLKPFPGPAGEVDYVAASRFKWPLLRRAHATFQADAGAEERRALDAFREDHAGWLGDYALFMALKDAHCGDAWTTWEPGLARRDAAVLAGWRERLAPAVEEQVFVQHLFSAQWGALRERFRKAGVRLLGDIPIFVAHDGADVWAHPELFQLDAEGHAAVVAGVPPDYFSATGQLWGNPLYDWGRLEAAGYDWWVERFRATLEQVDWVRLDHFRGFEAYWEIPGDAETAVGGRWVKGPGAAFFEALRDALGELPIVAENLGLITPEVEELRERFGMPGMAVLQFAFGGDGCDQAFQPHNFVRNLVAYTGTHDNDTLVGWWRAGVGESTRLPEQVKRERDVCLRYLGSDGREIHWDFIRALFASVADTVIVPMQDVLGLGNEARMNLPGRQGGNWRWRLGDAQLRKAPRARLRELAELYGRVPCPETAAAKETQA
jgi:4-alpha-glucanotransferase